MLFPLKTRLLRRLVRRLMTSPRGIAPLSSSDETVAVLAALPRPPLHRLEASTVLSQLRDTRQFMAKHFLDASSKRRNMSLNLSLNAGPKTPTPHEGCACSKSTTSLPASTAPTSSASFLDAEQTTKTTLVRREAKLQHRHNTDCHFTHCIDASPELPHRKPLHLDQLKTSTSLSSIAVLTAIRKKPPVISSQMYQLEILTMRTSLSSNSQAKLELFTVRLCRTSGPQAKLPWKTHRRIVSRLPGRFDQGVHHNRPSPQAGPFLPSA